MQLDKKKVDLILARKQISRKQLAESYGCTENRISAIVNCVDIRPVTAVKFADALGVDLDEILVD